MENEELKKVLDSVENKFGRVEIIVVKIKE